MQKVLLHIKHSNKGERTALDFKRVCTRGGQLLNGATDELTVKNLHIAAVPYYHARIVRIRCDFKSATGDRGTEIIRARRHIAILHVIIKRIVTW